MPATTRVIPDFCRALPEGEGAALPERLLLAAIGEFSGRDGRRYQLGVSEAAAIVAHLNSLGVDLPLDWEHATEIAAPQGRRADAAGWLGDWRVEPEGITARVEWSAPGAEAVRNRTSRYYSPAYLVDPESRRIVGITSAGLTSLPNLRLPALNHREESHMPIPAEIRQALGLAEDATPEQAAELIRTRTAELNRAQAAANTPDLARYVPRGDYDAALNRATAAETALREAQAAELNRQVETLIAQGLEQARITPATVEYHRAQAQTEGGLERLRQYLEAAPAVVAEGGPQGEPPRGTPELNAQAREIARLFGNSAEDLARYTPTEEAR